MPPQGRLALKCARRPFRPDLEGLVTAATDEQIAICAEADRPDTVFGISQHVRHEGMNGTNTTVINSPAGVPGQGRLALKCARRPYRPDLHGSVRAAASDEFAISTEADRHDPVLEISQHAQHGGMNSSNTR